MRVFFGVGGGSWVLPFIIPFIYLSFYSAQILCIMCPKFCALECELGSNPVGFFDGVFGFMDVSTMGVFDEFFIE